MSLTNCFSIEDIVAMDVEYGGGRTVPRVAIVDFNEQVVYYSDFCLRYEDWIETKLTEVTEEKDILNKQENPMYYSKLDQKIDVFEQMPKEDDLIKEEKLCEPD